MGDESTGPQSTDFAAAPITESSEWDFSSAEVLDLLHSSLSVVGPKVALAECGSDVAAHVQAYGDKWLVLGECFSTPTDHELSPYGLVPSLRNWADSHDVSISLSDGTEPGFRMEGALKRFEFHVWRNKPDVVLLFCGNSDAALGMQHCEEFEHQLLRFARRVKGAGCTLIINTPPCLLEVDESQIVDRLVYLEAIRACSAEEEVRLIDHWSHWESAAVQHGGTTAWYQPDGSNPDRKGFEQIAQLLYHQLTRMDCPSSSDETTNLYEEQTGQPGLGEMGSV